MIPEVVLLAVVELGVGGEHALELADGLADHAAVVPRGGLHGLAAQTLKAAVEPVEHGQIGLSDPAVSHHALGKGERAVEPHDVRHHVDVVVHPYHIEVVQRVLDAAPLSVLVEAGLVEIEVAQAALLMGLAAPEILGQLLDIDVLVFNSHLT